MLDSSTITPQTVKPIYIPIIRNATHLIQYLKHLSEICSCILQCTVIHHFMESYKCNKQLFLLAPYTIIIHLINNDMEQLTGPD